MNPYYQQKPKLLSAVGDSLGDLRSVLTQKVEKRKEICHHNSTINPSSSGIKLKKKCFENTKSSFSHTHNIKGLTQVLENRKISKNISSTSSSFPSSSSSSSSLEKKTKKKNEKNDQPKTTKAEEKALEKSREMLVKKAKIYDAMSKGKLVYDPEGETIMVDFQKKAQNYDEKDFYANESDNSPKNGRENGRLTDDCKQLLEYVDKFGRTRLLKKSEIDQLKANDPEERMEQKLKRSNAHITEPDEHDSNENNQQYENDAEFIADQEEFQERLKKEIHYQDIQDGEVREHGVAYYKFSTDINERNKQMEALTEIHKETLRMQRKVKNERKERRRVARERLVKICKEKGLPIPPEDPPSEDEGEVEKQEGNDRNKAKVEEPIHIQKATLKPNKPNKDGHREWDEGKHSDSYWKEAGLPVPSKRTPFFTQQQFVQKQRDERNPEFAPPQVYQDSSSVHRERNRK